MLSRPRLRYEDPNNLKPHPEAHLVPPMRKDEWDDFFLDVSMRGIRVPLEVAGDGTILDGHHRHRAALELAMTQVPVMDAALNGNTTTEYMLKAAVLRRHLTDGQRAAIAALWKKENRYEPTSRPRDEHGQFQPSPPRGGDGANLGQPTRQQATDLLNVGRKGVDKATYVLHRDPELLQAVHAGEVELNTALRQVKKRERPMPSALPTEVHDVIYADPPWPYNNALNNWGPADLHYNTMSLEEICAMAVPAADNAVLFLWVTNPFVRDAFRVIDAWGFQYKTNIVWVKTNLKCPGSGFYVRGRHELLFICTKGSFVPDQTGKEPIGSVIEAPVGEHSRKPEIAYDLIERIYPNAKYLELFARHERPGWTSWGSEAQ